MNFLGTSPLRKILILGLGIYPFFSPLSAYQLPKYELGLAYGSFSRSHYTGSNEYLSRNIIIPYGIYRFDKLDIGRSNRLYAQIRQLRVSLGFGFNLPIASKKAGTSLPAEEINDPKKKIFRTESYRRRGMEDLSFALGIGLQLTYPINTYIDVGAQYLYNIGNGYVKKGSIIRPSVTLHTFPKQSKYRLDLSYRWVFGSTNYNHLYYSVPEKYALPDRPAYQAKEGLTYETINLQFGYFPGRWYLFIVVFQHLMNQSVVKDSPLVFKSNSDGVVISVGYSFFTSKKKVFRNERI